MGLYGCEGSSRFISVSGCLKPKHGRACLEKNCRCSDVFFMIFRKMVSTSRTFACKRYRLQLTETVMIPWSADLLSTKCNFFSGVFVLACGASRYLSLRFQPTEGRETI